MSLSRFGRPVGAVLLPVALVPVALSAGPASADSSLFITSADENADFTVTLPLHVGASSSETIYDVVTDTNDGGLAQSAGVNRAQKIGNAADSTAVRHVTANAQGVIDFPATVNFAAVQHRAVAGPQGFPAATAQPGAVGETRYSPLIQLPDGTVENAPQLANTTGQAITVTAIDTVHHTVTYRETHGFQGSKAVHYISTDSSDPSPPHGKRYLHPGTQRGADRQRRQHRLVPGQPGQVHRRTDRHHQPSTPGPQLRDPRRRRPVQHSGLEPVPGPVQPATGRTPHQWTENALSNHQKVRQTDYGQIQNLADNGIVTGFNGTTFTASGFIVDCPIVAFGS